MCVCKLCTVVSITCFSLALPLLSLSLFSCSSSSLTLPLLSFFLFSHSSSSLTPPSSLALPLLLLSLFSLSLALPFFLPRSPSFLPSFSPSCLPLLLSSVGGGCTVLWSATSLPGCNGALPATATHFLRQDPAGHEQGLSRGPFHVLKVLRSLEKVRTESASLSTWVGGGSHDSVSFTKSRFQVCPINQQLHCYLRLS